MHEFIVNACNWGPMGYFGLRPWLFVLGAYRLMATESPLVRQWLLLKHLSSSADGHTVPGLATEMEVSEKTIRRDLGTLQDAGFPIEAQTGAYGRKTYRIAAAAHRPDIGFTFDEALALYMARGLLQPLAGTLFWEAAQRAFRKIRACIGPAAIDYVQRMSAAFHQTLPGVADYSRHAEIIDTLMIGIEDRRVVAVVYRSQRATEPVTYLVHPYGITYHRSSLYLVGFSEDHDELRHWKVDRIEEAELEKVLFQRPKNFDLQKHFAASFGVWHGHDDVHVMVRFSPQAARYVREKTWHASQQLEDQTDGGLVAHFRLSDTREVKSWVLSFGAEAEVLEPIELRKELAADVKRLSRKYHPDERTVK